MSYPPVAGGYGAYPATTGAYPPAAPSAYPPAGNYGNYPTAPGAGFGGAYPPAAGGGYPCGDRYPGAAAPGYGGYQQQAPPPPAAAGQWGMPPAAPQWGAPQPAYGPPAVGGYGAAPQPQNLTWSDPIEQTIPHCEGDQLEMKKVIAREYNASPAAAGDQLSSGNIEILSVQPRGTEAKVMFRVNDGQFPPDPQERGVLKWIIAGGIAAAVAYKINASRRRKGQSNVGWFR